MHDGAYAFVKSTAATLPPLETVYEVGGRFLNGRVRPLFPCRTYVSVDLFAGEDVDVVGDFTAWCPEAPADCVVCCEVLEHTPLGGQIVAHAWDLLRPEGFLVLTCATGDRAPHSALDGNAVRPDEWYRNVDPDQLRGALERAGFRVLEWRVVASAGDLYALAQRPAGEEDGNGRTA